MSTSKKRLLTHFVCARWKKVEIGTFDIILRPHIVRFLFRSLGVRFSFNFTSVTAVNQHTTRNNTVQRKDSCGGIFPLVQSYAMWKSEQKEKKALRGGKIEMLTNYLCIAHFVEQIFHEIQILTVNFIIFHFQFYLRCSGIPFMSWMALKAVRLHSVLVFPTRN